MMKLNEYIKKLISCEIYNKSKTDVSLVIMAYVTSFMISWI